MGGAVPWIPRGSMPGPSFSRGDRSVTATCQITAKTPGLGSGLGGLEREAAEAGSAKNERTRTPRNTRGQAVWTMTAPFGSTRVHPSNGRAELLCPTVQPDRSNQGGSSGRREHPPDDCRHRVHSRRCRIESVQVGCPRPQGETKCRRQLPLQELRRCRRF